MVEKRITCWHFLSDDKRLRWGTKEIVKVGKTYTATGPLKMCENGMHGSRRLLDALQYATGSVLCKVQIWGEIEEQNDKLVGRNRKVLAMIDATMMLHEAACHFAETVLKLVYCKDERSWNAIKIKRLWLKGKATDKELDAARDAARAAARAATGAAAWAAARAAAGAAAGATAGAAAGAAARAAARAAAGDTAGATAWAAAGDTAGATAWATAWATAGAAAGAAARDAQNKYLETRVMKLFPRKENQR